MELNQFSLQELKDLEVAILDYIDEVCKRHNISYYLAYGTLIGAIRHKGFIPWDDDIDICMLREDYNRFIEVTKSNTDRYRLFHFSNTAGAYIEYAKVVDSHTEIISGQADLVQGDGVWVDIFPLDYIPRNVSIIRPIIKLSRTLRVLSVQPQFPNKHSRILYPLWFVGRIVGYKPFLKLTNWLSQTANSGEEIGFMATLSSQYSSKFAYPAKWFKEAVLVDFEGKKYPAPKYFDEYLQSQYGDYMQLPPIEKRVSHPMNAYWKKEKQYE